MAGEKAALDCRKTYHMKDQLMISGFEELNMN
jgi:hypothetical protein